MYRYQDVNKETGKEKVVPKITTTRKFHDGKLHDRKFQERKLHEWKIS